MSNLENEYQKRFSNKKLSGDDFDADGLWNDISNDLDNGTFPKNDSFWRFKWIFSFGAVLVIVGMIGFAFWKKNKTTALAKIEKTVEVESINSQSNYENSSIKPEKDIQSFKKEKKEISTFSKVVDSSQNSVRLLNKNTDVSTLKKEKNQEIKIDGFQEVRKNSEEIKDIKYQVLNSQDNLTSKQFEKNLTSDFNNPISHNSSTSNFSKNNLKNNPVNPTSKKPNRVIDLKPLSERFMNLNLKGFNVPSYTLSNIADTRPKNSQPSKWKIEFVGGANVIHLKSYAKFLNTEFAEAKNKSTKLFPGSSFGVLVNYKLHRNLLINSGIEYHQLQSKFDYQDEKDIDLVKEDQLLKVWISETTGDTLNLLRMDTTVSAKEIRTVVHYNQYNRITIPIEFGIRRNNGQLIYGLSGGPVFNYTISQTGKNLSLIGVADIGSENKQFAFLEFGLRLRSVIGLQINEKIAITLQPQWTWSHTPEIRIDSYAKSNNHQFNLNIGLGYDF